MTQWSRSATNDEEVEPLCEIFVLFAQWYNQRFNTKGGKRVLSTHKPLFRHTFKWRGDEYLFLANGSMDRVIDPETGTRVDAFHLSVFKNGWPCAYLSPYSGDTVGLTTEDDLVSLLETNIRKDKTA